MAQQTIGIGTVANDGTGDPLRTAFTKANANDTELYAASVSSFIANNWYLPVGLSSLQAGPVAVANSIRLHPGVITQKITLSNLGVRCTTLAVGGNIQAAIYANNAATNRPTGSALVSTASMSTTTAGNINAAASIQLTAGIYWFATNIDNTTATFPGPGNTGSLSALVGAVAQNDSLQNSIGLAGVATPVTFGTWGSLSAATFTEVQTGSTTHMPLVQFQVASVP